MTETTILDELTYHPESGSLRYQNVRYLLIRPETLAALQTALEAEIGTQRAGEILFEAGFTGGQLSARKYKETFGFEDRQVVEFMCRMGGEIGWGHFRLTEMDTEAQRLVVSIDQSPFALAYPSKAHAGVCHFTRGVMAGVASGIFHETTAALEPLCVAKGDPRCQFVIESRK